MVLSQQEKELFFKLWYALVWNVNEKHKVVPPFKMPVFGKSISQKPFIAVRDQIWENPKWIDEFLQARCSDDLTVYEREIVTGWRENYCKERFIVVRHLRKYSVFMTISEPIRLYGVIGISDPIRAKVEDRAPFMLEAVLIPFCGKIIYDGFVYLNNISFGRNMRDSFSEEYMRAKTTVGIIENMLIPPIPATPKEKKPKPLKPAPPTVDTKGANVPKAMSSRYMEVADIIERFCEEKLNDEYKEICLRALAKLCRKRPSPLLTGKANTWACGIVYAIGSVNFIFDKSQPMSMTAAEIAEWFGLSKSTAGGKASEINKLLDLSYFNMEFLLQEHIDTNPAIWYLSVDGIIVDARHLPRELQEKAFDMGLIPYIPADRAPALHKQEDKEDLPVAEKRPKQKTAEIQKKKQEEIPIEGQLTFDDVTTDE